MKINLLGSMAAAAMLLLISNAALAVINIRTEKGGKILLIVDDESVRTEAGGKPVLVIDGPNILTEKGGKRLFFIDGDILHTEPEGPICAYIDGRHIKTAPGGAELFYLNGKEIKPNHDGPVLYYVDGQDMGRQQLMAVLFTLRPDLIKRAGDAPAPTPPATTTPPADAPAATTQPAASSADPAAPAATVKDLDGGNYTLSIIQASDSSKHQGSATIKKQGEVFVIDLKFSDAMPWQAVAVQNKDELWAAIGPVNTVGLVVYQVSGGNLAGTWMNVTGEKSSFGSENLTGADPLGGDYKITDAKAPFTGAAYTGVLTLDPLAIKTTEADAPFFHLGWDLGGGYKVQGVGFKANGHLIGASSTAPDCGVIRFKIDPSTGTLTGDFYTAGKANGQYTLTKDK